MAFLYGVFGTVAVLALFGLGVFAGWRLCKFDERRSVRRTAQELTESERRKLEEQQDAFRQLQNYNADVAYGNKGRELGGERT